MKAMYEDKTGIVDGALIFGYVLEDGRRYRGLTTKQFFIFDSLDGFLDHDCFVVVGKVKKCIVLRDPDKDYIIAVSDDARSFGDRICATWRGPVVRLHGAEMDDAIKAKIRECDGRRIECVYGADKKTALRGLYICMLEAVGQKQCG